MAFQHPQAFLLLVVLLPLLSVVLLGKKRTESVIHTFKAPPPRLRHHLARFAFVALFIGSLVAVGAKPYSELEETGNYLFLVDVSRSMQARNSCVEPAFLDRAKQVMRKVLAGVPEGKFGIAAYERITFPITHMTYDHGYLEEVIEHGIYPGMIYDRTDTQTGRALAVIAEKKQKLPEAYGDLEYIILLSDGYMGRVSRATLEDPLRKLKDAGIKVISVAIANERPTPIPIEENGACVNKFIVKDGELVTIPLDSETLQAVARETGGKYYGEAEMDQLVAFIRENTLARTLVEGEDVLQRPRDDVSWIFLILASIGLLGYILIDSGFRLK